MYKWINSLLVEKNFQMKETVSCIDLKELCTMKPKKLVSTLKPVVTPNMMKDKNEKIDAEVLLYI